MGWHHLGGPSAEPPDDERLEDLAEDQFYEQQQQRDDLADKAEDAWLRSREKS